ncbi:MAG: imidazolonepropionase, partial [Deltaproteobacteria bacterium]|nr:imidazolonepropionase [Deltaproteobacteria bacterium]
MTSGGKEILFYNITSLLRIASSKTRKLKDEMRDLEEIQNAYLVVKEGRIAALGMMSQAPRLSQFPESVNCKDRLVLPGFVDSHTHLLYVGNRADEFEMRSQGKSYEEIA